MSDELARLADGMTAVPRERMRVDNHTCEYAGCGLRAPFGFARPRQDPHWFWVAHRSDGDRIL